MSIKTLVENKSTLDYKSLTLSLIQELGINDPINWDAVIPANVQHNLFGGEILRLFSDHESFANQKDIRTIVLKKGETSQLLILFAQLKDEKLSKVNIERVTKKFIGGQAAERYVVWFLGNPENTQFKVVLSGKEGKKIVLKTLPFGSNLPYYKTYDFILDEVHKKVSGFFVEPNELWKALWKSFDISVVNKRFYEDVKKSFDLLVNNNILSGVIRNVEARKQFVVRLIGRIIFCWFLKKKTIIDESVLSSSAIKKYEDYYGQFLEKLFFDVFNTPQKERRKDLPEEIKNYPFLNGGLFEDQKGDFGDYKGYINIPNEWFEDIFKNTLEKYNFTIDENTSANSEIAIDPEMLGRIFENLLAEQNPETQESARKATGSYYTPREIVDYMVEQSLIEYLKSNVIARNEETQQSNPHSHSELVSESLSQAIEDFVHTEELQELSSYSNQILEKLNSVKVLDPACGSGAFPIGMLQKLIALKLQFDIPPSGGKRGAGVYDLKLSTILNSIYGCDIQPMAVELSRLRCWLSLIIDEPVDKKKENWGIENLPNLDFKFVCVNTLISLPKMTEDSLGTSADDFEKLKELRTEFFTASAKRKIKIEDEFKQLQVKIAEKHREWSTKNTESVLMLTSWNPFKVDETDWFDPFWMFGIIDGFDLVIANPPYINIANLDAEKRELYKHNFKITKNKCDVYGYFIERSNQILNNNGVLTFIIPHTWKATTSFSKLRELLFTNFILVKIVELGLGVFDAIVKPVVITLNKQKVIPNEYEIEVLDSELKNTNSVYFSEINATKEYILDTTSSSIQKKLYQKIENDSLTLGSVLHFSRGIKTSNDKKFIRTNPFKDNSYKIFRGKNIKSYQLNWGGEHIWYRPDLMKEKVGSLPHSSEFFNVPEKLVTQRVNSSMQLLVAYDDEQNYFLDTTNVSNYKTWDRRYSLKYLCAIMNSKAINFWYCNKYRMPTIGIYELESIPIKELAVKSQNSFIAIVDTIIKAKKTDQINTKQFEDQIDIMVYKLYNLTYKEIKIIDPNIEQIISKDDYEKYELRE